MLEQKARRAQLMQRMGENSIAILPTAPEQVRNRDVHYPFRPDSDFYYLTGFDEPMATLVLIPERKKGEYLLFCREKNAQSEQWEGYRAGLSGAVTDYGADEAFAYSDLDSIMPELLEQRDQVFYTLGQNSIFDQRVIGWLNQARQKVRNGIQPPTAIISLESHLHDMRLYKTKAEIAILRAAAQISAEAHQVVMQNCQPSQYEYQLAADFQHYCQQQGANALAYPSIVASGNHACTLHYTNNHCMLREGDLVLMDAGCELGYYASDITRTFPVSKQFSGAQAQLYELVLAAQQAAIDQVKPGNHWNMPHIAAVSTLADGLLQLGLLQGDLETVLNEETYKRFYMHRTGHWLGMDVHDVGDYKVDGSWRELKPGMLLTVEPGLYISREETKVAEKWRGIGIRIEDDVLVTQHGHEILSHAVPKQIHEIEALRAERKKC